MLTVEQLFKNYSTKTVNGGLASDRVKQAALAFAKVIEDNVKDEEYAKMAIHSIMQARMFADCGINIDELNFIEKINKAVKKEE